MVAILDAVLLTTVLGWLTLAALILIDRARHDRRTSRLALLRTQLVQAGSTDLERLAAGVTAVDFDQLVFEGVPSRIEAVLGRALLAGPRRPAVLGSALGTNDGDLWSRIRAAQILTSARTADVHHMLDDMLRAGNRILAGAALRLFVRQDDRRSADLLVRALMDGVYSRSRIAAAFTALSIERADTLEPLFASEEPECRYWAARLACVNLTRQWAPRVRELTADRDPLVRRAAVEALGAIGAPGDAGAVLDLLSDPVPFVRAHAVKAAASFSAARNAVALRQLLNDGAWIVRSAAAEVLGTTPRTGRGSTA